MDIISRFKASTEKNEEVKKIIEETGMSAKEIFQELLEAHAVDGRTFRKSEYAEEWKQAQAEYRKSNVKESTDTCMSLKEQIDALRKDKKALSDRVKQLESENEELNSRIEVLLNSETPSGSEPCTDTVPFEKRLEIAEEICEADKEIIDNLNKTVAELKNKIQIAEGYILKNVVYRGIF